MEIIPLIKCPICAAPFSEDTFRIYDVDGSDECEDGRFGPPTYSIKIACTWCKTEFFHKEDAISSYGKPD